MREVGGPGSPAGGLSSRTLTTPRSFSAATAQLWKPAIRTKQPVPHTARPVPHPQPPAAAHLTQLPRAKDAQPAEHRAVPAPHGQHGAVLQGESPPHPHPTVSSRRRCPLQSPGCVLAWSAACSGQRPGWLLLVPLLRGSDDGFPSPLTICSTPKIITIKEIRLLKGKHPECINISSKPCFSTCMSNML